VSSSVCFLFGRSIEIERELRVEIAIIGASTG
jgi:hypothetical protein